MMFPDGVELPPYGASLAVMTSFGGWPQRGLTLADYSQNRKTFAPMVILRYRAQQGRVSEAAKRLQVPSLNGKSSALINVFKWDELKVCS